MDGIIIFNHIPRTGGTTLRVVLNRVYGESGIFFINSRDIPASLDEYNNLSLEEQAIFKVVSGHGALHFHPRQRNKFTITVLREPISLFISQYHYLRKSPNSNYLEEVSTLSSLDAYIDYVVERGQDNMMVRCLDPKNQQFTQDGALPPNMEEEGEEMLRRALASLVEHDTVMELRNFDKDLFRLARSLRWEKIPLYRPLNKGKYTESMQTLYPHITHRLKQLLRFDIELYHKYSVNIAGRDDHRNKYGIKYLTFMGRQALIRCIMK